MRKLDSLPSAYLYPPRWSSRVTLGPVVITLAVKRHNPLEGTQPQVLNNRLAALRRERSLSQQELAHTLRISVSTLQALEEGHYTPSLALAFSLSTFFELPIEAIFSRV